MCTMRVNITMRGITVTATATPIQFVLVINKRDPPRSHQDSSVRSNSSTDLKSYSETTPPPYRIEQNELVYCFEVRDLSVTHLGVHDAQVQPLTVCGSAAAHNIRRQHSIILSSDGPRGWIKRSS